MDNASTREGETDLVPPAAQHRRLAVEEWNNTGCSLHGMAPLLWHALLIVFRASVPYRGEAVPSSQIETCLDTEKLARDLEEQENYMSQIPVNPFI